MTVEFSKLVARAWNAIDQILGGTAEAVEKVRVAREIVEAVSGMALATMGPASAAEAHASMAKLEALLTANDAAADAALAKRRDPLP